MAKLPTSSPGWQWQQTQQRFGEWFEQLLNQPKPNQRPSRPWSWAWLDAIAPYITIALCVILAVLILFILVRSIRAWRLKRQRRQAMAGGPQVNLETPPVSQSEWLSRAQQYQRQGNFTEAARALYFALLQNLNDRAIIPERRSLTDREYVAITQNLPQPSAFATLLQTHEQIEFAGSSVSAQDFEQCQAAYEQTNGAIAKAQQQAQQQQAQQQANSGKQSGGKR